MIKSYLFFTLCLILSLADVPFYPKYPTRTTYVLDGTWDFGFSTTADPLHIDPKNVSTPENITVPGSFDVTAPGILGRRGTAFYKTTIKTSKANVPLLLYFTACSFYCSVFVDDVSIGDHRAGGYQPFWLEVGGSENVERSLLVVVNNQFNSETAPTHTGGDFYMYGGITRNVIVHEMPNDPYLRQVETFTVDWKTGSLNARAVFGGSNANTLASASISLSWDGGKGTPRTVPVKNGVAVLTNLMVPNPTPWSLESPNLHTLQLNYLKSDGTIIDAILVRFGIRSISTIKDGTGLPRFAINDKIVKLHGINRHTMWPDTGSALTLEQVTTDVTLLRQMGINYVRGAHYPQDPRFLDLCDENGIAIWEETLGPGVSTADLLNPYFMKYQIQAVNEMIDASINHPCVILHGFYNEGPSNDAKARPGYNASATAIRERVGNPPTRFVTWASNQATHDVCLDITDVISFNSYPGWYDHPNDLSYIVPFWEGQIDWVTQHYPQKAFFISETGGGGVYEWTNSSHPFWSQGYQSDVLQLEATFAMKNDSLSGITIWQFADIKANDGDTKNCGQCDYLPHPPSLSDPWTCGFISVKCGRPGGENHKGSVDFWRRPKQAFTTLQKIYTST